MGLIERAVQLDGEPAPLHGTLTLPDGADACDGALILAGSGPVDRDGNVLGARNDSLKLLAHGLAEQGIATLRVDKRGIAASGAAAPREEDLRFDGYVADAARWLKRLGEDERIRRRFVIGHSEGALVGTLVAQRVPPAGLVLVAGAGEPAAVAIRRQLSAAGLPVALMTRAETALDALERGGLASDPPSELADLLRPSVQPYLISWFRHDPVAALAKVSVPLLVVQGSTDLQVTIADALRLGRARPGIAVRLIDGMNHVLKRAPADPAPNLAAYDDPDLPLAPGLVPTLVDFIRR